MPELPEVESVRRGLDAHVTGARVRSASVSHPRAIRWHEAGADDFEGLLADRRVERIARRGKYLWWAFDDGDALVAHLGMSGQFRIHDPESPVHPHTRARFLLDSGRDVRFVDQRTFGWLRFSPGGAQVPDEIAHVGLDPLDPGFDVDDAVARLRKGRRGVKHVLLDQTWVSGVGNIYADESLWRARIHPLRPADSLSVGEASALVGHVGEVLTEALAAGGTSFDALYVNVNGESGYFDRSLNAYGREDQPCLRCGTLMVREKFANRSSHFCPGCQRLS